jgi:3-methyl-2-oxobutanoate hydroxymethyltransferase
MFGGFKVQGRTAEAAMKILEDALAIQDAGCFMLEFEAVPAKIARVISRQLEIPTIGIGAGAGTDAQVLVWTDMAGLTGGKVPRFTKQYANLRETLGDAARAFAEDVSGGAFPAEEHTFH